MQTLLGNKTCSRWLGLQMIPVPRCKIKAGINKIRIVSQKKRVQMGILSMRIESEKMASKRITKMGVLCMRDSIKITITKPSKMRITVNW